jgi:hypothetical protein
MQKHIPQMKSKRIESPQYIIELKRNERQRNVELRIEMREDVAEIFPAQSLNCEILSHEQRVIDRRKILEERMTKS